MTITKGIKVIISLFLMIGVVCPIVSTSLFEGEHRTFFGPLSIFCAFMGTGLMFGFSNFRTKPKNIGNFDEDKIKPDINQTWMVFFISLVANLFFANLCG